MHQGKSAKWTNYSHPAHREENARLTNQSKLSELVVYKKRLIQYVLILDLLSITWSEREGRRMATRKTQGRIFIPISFPKVSTNMYVVDGSLPGTIRFYPQA